MKIPTTHAIAMPTAIGNSDLTGSLLRYLAKIDLLGVVVGGALGVVAE